MRNVRIGQVALKQHFEEEAGTINDVLNSKDLPAYDQAFRNVLKKEVISYLISNSDEVATEVADAFGNKYASFGAFSVSPLSGQVLFFATFMGCLIQPKPVDGGNVYYRKDKNIVIYISNESCYIAYNKLVVDGDKLAVLIKRYVDPQAESIDEKQAMSVAYRANYNSTSLAEFDISSGFLNTAINGLFIDSNAEGFTLLYYSLLAVKALQGKSTEFYKTGYLNYSYPVLGNLAKSEDANIANYITVQLTAETIRALVEKQYISENFELQEKGRLLLSLHYLMAPIETLGLSGYVNFKSPIFSSIMQAHNEYIAVGKNYFKSKFWSEEIAEDFKLMNGEAIVLPEISEITRVHAHSERLNAQQNFDRFYGRQLVSIDGYLEAWKLNLASFDTMVTLFSQLDTGMIYVAPSIFYRTIINKAPSAEFFVGPDKVYAVYNDEIIGFAPCISEPFSEFAVMTALPYTSYGPIPDLVNIGLFQQATSPIFKEEPISDAELSQIMSAPIINVYQLINHISQKHSGQINEALLLDMVMSKRKSEFVSNRRILLSAINNAFLVISEALNDSAITEQNALTLRIEDKNLSYYKKLLETL